MKSKACACLSKSCVTEESDTSVSIPDIKLCKVNDAFRTYIQRMMFIFDDANDDSYYLPSESKIDGTIEVTCKPLRFDLILTGGI